MAAAMASTTVETASAMEPATTAVKAFASVEATAITATAVPTATIAISAVTIVTAMAVISVAIVTATTVEAAAVVAAVVPGASADEDATEEVVRAIVAVGSAGVGIVAVVTVGADWRWADGAVHGTYSNRYADLRVGAARGEKQNS